MTTLTEFLTEHHHPLELSNHTLNGPGANFLHARAQESQFMLIGEEHGVGSNLEFANALFNAIQPLGYSQYVTEVGPVSAEHIKRLAREPDMMVAFHNFYTQYPFSIPFAWWKEEVQLLKAVSAANSEGGIHGIDQEFIFSPQLHLDTLLNTCTDPNWKSKLTAWLEIEQQANLALVSGTPPDQLTSFMTLPLPAEWDTLRQYFESQRQLDMVALMDALQASHQIYMHYANKEYYDNNNVRGQAMRKYFYAAYQKAMTTHPEARFLIKLGANHVARGHTPMGILDIGTFIAELAYQQDIQSFHMIVLPISGAQNAWLPFLPESFKAHPVESDYGPEFAPLLEAAPVKSGWNLYDLRPLRHRQTYWSKDNPAFKDLFLRYDAILLMENVQAATLVAP